MPKKQPKRVPQSPKAGFIVAEMDLRLRELFHKYTLVVREECARKRLPLPSGSLILGAILTQYLVAHHEEILEMHAQVHSQRALAATAELCASVGVPLPEAALTTRASAALFDPATKNTRGARFPSPPRR